MHDILEQPYPGAGSGVPVIEDRDEPVGVRGVRRAGHSPGRRRCPRSVRKQEVDPRWIEFREGLVRRHGVVAKVDGTQQPAEKVAVLCPRQLVQAGRDRSVTASPAGEPAMPVM